MPTKICGGTERVGERKAEVFRPSFPREDTEEIDRRRGPSWFVAEQAPREGATNVVVVVFFKSGGACESVDRPKTTWKVWRAPK